MREEAAAAVQPMAAQVATYASAAARHRFRYECASAGSQTSVRDDDFKVNLAKFYKIKKNTCMVLSTKLPSHYVIGAPRYLTHYDIPTMRICPYLAQRVVSVISLSPLLYGHAVAANTGLRSSAPQFKPYMFALRAQFLPSPP